MKDKILTVGSLNYDIFLTVSRFPEEGEKTVQETDSRTYKETQYDILADTMRRYLDMKKIYEILEQGGRNPVA